MHPQATMRDGVCEAYIINIGGDYGMCVEIVDC